MNLTDKKEKLDDFALYLTRRLLEMSVDQYSDADQIKELIERINIEGAQKKMYFLTSLCVVVRRYPDALFPKPEARTNILDAIQECLDEIILEEGD